MADRFDDLGIELAWSVYKAVTAKEPITAIQSITAQALRFVAREEREKALRDMAEMIRAGLHVDPRTTAEDCAIAIEALIHKPVP
ncbi:hypothetical protein WV31_05360 [Magnetospirillum sp. ME-1]|uniref:hypothetical protein n=1 Tax=Magnetospirillum sp. ME-1 TaxID=1639348 RepID=UPI000A17E3FE|nr:hypothetical protein [Magnetospirillum sp. ME-1]ARJ65128.1 hypothetical protein WV31_05360 [Magnetospirillum sp. ME-1]